MADKETAKPLFSIKFIGRGLDYRNVPVYELGQVLISVQRLFHKAHLADQERLEKGASPDKSERRQLALQIGAHEKGSDYYGLIPFLSSPECIHALHSAAKFVMEGLASYALKEVLSRIQRPDGTKSQIYIGSIHAEVVNIVDRIDGLSGCEGIQIGCPQINPQLLNLDAGTREYVHKVEGDIYLGSIQELHGAAFKFLPNILMVEIRRRPSGRKCKLFLSEQDFNAIRYGQTRSPLITVAGRPRHRIGTERRSFDEFEVTKVISIEDEDQAA